jgi:hypothetical protein
MPKGASMQAKNPPNSAAYAAAQNNHANQHNPNSAAYAAAQNNRANQMNPNNPAYTSSRK